MVFTLQLLSNVESSMVERSKVEWGTIGTAYPGLLSSRPAAPIHGAKPKGAAMPPAKATDTPTEQWEEIQPFTQPRELGEGEEFTAYYRGASELTVPDPNGEDGSKRNQLLHEFSDNIDSEPYGLWGSAVLDKRLAECPIGARVRVLYEGKQDLDGGRTARRYRVWIDRSQPF